MTHTILEGLAIWFSISIAFVLLMLIKPARKRQQEEMGIIIRFPRERVVRAPASSLSFPRLGDFQGRSMRHD